MLFLVPPVVLFMAKSPLVEEYDLSSVKRGHCGAASLPTHVMSDFMKRLKIPEMRQGAYYGYVVVI
jgi:hypothetical protein